MGDLTGVLVEHARRYPGWQVADVYKLIHQAVLGSEHAVSEAGVARGRLAQELASMGPGPWEPLVDPISADGAIVRVHLRSYAALALETEPLLQAFLKTARGARGSAREAAACLKTASLLAARGELVVAASDIAELSGRVRSDGFPAMHHSAAFVAAYRPAYRVVECAFLPIGVLRRAE